MVPRRVALSFMEISCGERRPPARRAGSAKIGRVATLPDRRIVVEFDFTGRNARRLWLVLDRRDVSVCLKPPGFPPSLVIRTDLRLFYRVWLGALAWSAAVRSGGITIEGAPALARELPTWFLWSPMAKFVKAPLHAEAGREAP
jgi:hypothetical protein